MSEMTGERTGEGDRALVLERLLDAPREAVWRCWTQAGLLRRWFAPAPWEVVHAVVDPRSGGLFETRMRGPAGEEVGAPGVFLEVRPPERLVFTDAYVRAWEPSGKPFMTVTIALDDPGGGRTLYTARAMHWSADDRRAHEEMGFQAGWGRCADQLERVAREVAGGAS